MTRRTQFRLLVAFTIVWLAWAVWALLGQSQPFQLQVLDDLGSPVASAVVDSGGSQVGATGEDGQVEIVWTRSTKVLEVSAPGHISRRITLADPPQDEFEVVLKARVLRGRVVDPDGEGVAAATVQAGDATTTTDSEGYFELRGAEEGTVEVSRPAWISDSFTWEGGSGESVVEIEPFVARAVHIDGESMRNDFQRFFDMAMETELNALMIDLKDETGEVWYDTENPIAVDIG
ncbi:MAG: carboxypeptidase regulatory-like domain-containing protein, partial [Actinomycetota bacterium]